MSRFVSSSLLLLVAFSTISIVQSLDVEVVGVTCDDSLPVTADLKLKDCVAGSRCTFGQDATIYGSLNYAGVENSGIADNLAYVTADLSLFSMTFNVVDMIQVPLCDETMVAADDNANACPGDGTQNYEIAYKLPSAGKEYTSWIASGWDGSGVIQMFAQQDDTMKIGECTLQLKTYVTRSQERKSLLSTPSAAATAGIVLASLAVAAMACLYCYCCCQRRRTSKNGKNEDDEESRFQRLEEEKSYWSGGLGSRRSKKSVATKSVVATKKEGEVDTVISELPE